MFDKHKTLRTDSVERLITDAQKYVHEHGERFPTPTGTWQVTPTTTLILDNPTGTNGRYVSWDIDAEELYLELFVRPENQPEKNPKGIVFPYTYAWRSRYHDDGWGYVVSLVQLLRSLNYTDLPFERTDDLAQLIRETYHVLHPDVLLAVLAWLKRENLLLFLINHKIPQEILKQTRKDTLLGLIDELMSNPASVKAITPSMIYNTTDTRGFFSHTPSFLNYQIKLIFDAQDTPIGFESFHFQRSMDAAGSIQLDIAHDLEWARVVAEKTGLLLMRLTLHVNQLFLDQKSTQSSDPVSIRQALMASSGGYDPRAFDVETYLATQATQHKLTMALNQFLTVI